MAAGSNGNCYLCGAELGKTAMKNHLLKAHGGGGQECRLLRVEGAYDKNYWLYLDIPIEKTLSAVDAFLRKIWLECCGHMSAFFGPGRSEIGKSRKISAFSVGDKLSHEYDFGSTTETVVSIMGSVTRQPQREIVRLLARNVPPQFPCAKCGATAECLCAACMYSPNESYYCAKCGKQHEHEGYLLPVTNSPRMGTCAYDGELDVFAFNPGKLPQK